MPTLFPGRKRRLNVVLIVFVFCGSIFVFMMNECLHFSFMLAQVHHTFLWLFLLSFVLSLIAKRLAGKRVSK